jgi:hypothetical protein
MPYEIFERQTPRTGTPMLSFSKIGGISFNQPASRLLQKEAYDYVLLLWDASAKKLALKATANKKDPRSYLIRYNTKGNGAGFSAKTFLDHVGIDYSRRKALPVEIHPNREFFIEVAIPDALFAKEEAQQTVPFPKAASAS